MELHHVALEDRAYIQRCTCVRGRALTGPRILPATSAPTHDGGVCSAYYVGQERMDVAGWSTLDTRQGQHTRAIHGRLDTEALQAVANGHQHQATVAYYVFPLLSCSAGPQMRPRSTL